MNASEKHHVRYLSAKAVRDGALERQPCEICGDTPAECHHIDYADPKRVMWLCTLHHAQTHSQFGRPAPLFWDMDIRAAVRRIDRQRLALRARRPEGGLPSSHYAGIDPGALPPEKGGERALPPPQVLPPKMLDFPE